MSAGQMMDKRKGFMAEGKPGFPDALNERLLQHERLRNEQLTNKLAEIVDEFAEATIQVIKLRRRNMKLKSQKSDLMGVCNDLRERLEESDSVLLRREILTLRKSNETLRRMMKEEK